MEWDGPNMSVFLKCLSRVAPAHPNVASFNRDCLLMLSCQLCSPRRSTCDTPWDCHICIHSPPSPTDRSIDVYMVWDDQDLADQAVGALPPRCQGSSWCTSTSSFGVSCNASAPGLPSAPRRAFRKGAFRFHRCSCEVGYMTSSTFLQFALTRIYEIGACAAEASQMPQARPASVQANRFGRCWVVLVVHCLGRDVRSQ